MIKNLPAKWETYVQFLGRDDPLEKGLATHFSIHAWRIPWTEEPGGLQPKGSQRVGHDGATNTLASVKYIWEKTIRMDQFSSVQSLSRVWLFAIPWTVTHQAPLSMEFSRHEYWSGLPFPSPVDLPDPGNKPVSPTLQADSLTSEPPGTCLINYTVVMDYIIWFSKCWTSLAYLRKFPLGHGT